MSAYNEAMGEELRHNLVLVEDAVWVVTQPTGMRRYDFEFEQFLQCRHPFRREGIVRAVARMGAAGEYAKRYADLLAEGVRLVHTPEEYERTSQLPGWYSLIEDLTPRSIWFDERPPVEAISAAFDWPVFVKGARQTSKHQRHLSILDGPEHFERVMDAWQADPILHAVSTYRCDWWDLSRPSRFPARSSFARSGGMVIASESDRIGPTIITS